MSLNLLIINPNSSESVTTNLANLLTEPEGIVFHYFTAPENAPKEIDGYEETVIASTEACIPSLERIKDQYDGFLVCCYSDHPLIYKLRNITSKPVLGIFQASLVYSLSKSPSKFGILTSTTSWESILDKSVVDFFGGVKIPLFNGTIAANVNVLKLGDPKYYSLLEERTKILVERGSEIILLGCAGLSGLEPKLKKSFPGVQFIDTVKIGSELLVSFSRFEK
ncbi:hypothetical protein WICMUC_003793 [Wickerhamomyces mucosus]|uniref:Protein DCG1 n=1 Tax=Wickerhamomyces mucosus TaxID=1378264 RepID=A0A9P8PJB2_9ASCO|nr:hypothetical protein WICMUC_003793 [Wickerhamomyces mucosus]